MEHNYGDHIAEQILSSVIYIKTDWWKLGLVCIIVCIKHQFLKSVHISTRYFVYLNISNQKHIITPIYILFVCCIHVSHPGQNYIIIACMYTVRAQFCEPMSNSLLLHTCMIFGDYRGALTLTLKCIW
jgi:hypothetical protein